MLRRGWTAGTAQLIPLMHLVIRLSHGKQVGVLERHWAQHRPDMVVSLIPHYNRALKSTLDRILIRQYLKMGGGLLGFNVDPSFSNVLDALIVADLRSAPLALLERCMGRPAAKALLERQNLGLSVAG